MDSGHQYHFAEVFETHAYSHMVFRFSAEPGYDQPFAVCFAGTAVRHEYEIRLGAGYKLRGPGQAFPICPGAAVALQLFGRCPAKPLKEGSFIIRLFLALDEIPQFAALQFSTDFEDFIHTDIDVDAIGLAMARRTGNIIGRKSEVRFITP